MCLGTRVWQWAAALPRLLSKGMTCAVLSDPFACKDSSRALQELLLRSNPRAWAQRCHRLISAVRNSAGLRGAAQAAHQGLWLQDWRAPDHSGLCQPALRHADQDFRAHAARGPENCAGNQHCRNFPHNRWRQGVLTWEGCREVLCSTATTRLPLLLSFVMDLLLQHRAAWCH